MAECEWVILCDYAFAAQGNKLCMVGVFDNISTASVPQVHLMAAIGFSLIGESGETVDLQVQVVRPTGGVLQRLGGPTDLGPAGVTRGSVTLQGMVLPDFGSYAIEIYDGEELLRSTTFVVKRLDPPSSAPDKGWKQQQG